MKWEYKIITNLSQTVGSESEFNRLGGEGWELAAVAVFNGAGYAPLVQVIFKRAVSDTITVRGPFMAVADNVPMVNNIPAYRAENDIAVVKPRGRPKKAANG